MNLVSGTLLKSFTAKNAVDVLIILTAGAREMQKKSQFLEKMVLC